MTAGASKAAPTMIQQPAPAPSPQPRPAPTGRALPPNLAAQGGQNWTPIRGQIWAPIDRQPLRERTHTELAPAWGFHHLPACVPGSAVRWPAGASLAHPTEMAADAA